MSINKAAVTHAVTRKDVYNELLAWVVRCVGHNEILVCWILMGTAKSASLADTTRSSRIIVREIDTNCVFLVPLHSNVTRMSRGRMNIFV